MKLLAVIPARVNSRRLFGKNFRQFFGKPIISWAIDEAVKSEIFDKIVISTDYNGQIDDYDVTVEKRNIALCSDTATVDEVCLDVLSRYQGYDYMCCIYPTAYAVMWEDLLKGFGCYSYGMLNGKYNSDNGGFYWCKVEDFLRTKKIPMQKPYKMEMVDINTIEDFMQAKIHAKSIWGKFKC